jgi:uncharacterized delta-60 repeat protein
MARLNGDGTTDNVFMSCVGSGTEWVSAITAPTGSGFLGGWVLVGGLFTNLELLSPIDGSFATSIDVNGEVRAIAVQADGKVLVGGSFISIGGQVRNGIARLNNDGTVDTAFNPNTNAAVNTMAVQADGKILVGGEFNSIAGQARYGIARLNSDGTLDGTFNTLINNFVTAIAVQADGKILVGGNFTGLGGPPRSYLARLNTDGTLDNTFFSFANDLVYAIALQADGKILVGGRFTSIDGAPRNYIARLNTNAGPDLAFDPNANNWVYGISVQSDGKIVLGGEFTAVGPLGGQPRNHIARLLNDTAALQDLSVTQTAVTWSRSGAAPELTRATFELSPDGTTYSFLGNGVRVGVTSNFTLTGQNLPTGQNIYVRARGFYRGGYQTGSESVTDFVQNVFLSAPTPTPSPTPTPTPAYAAQIQQPINADGSSAFNVRRGVVPVKFTLTLNGAATCNLPGATIAVYRTGTGWNQQVDESIYSGPADTGSNFRTDSCQYVYNLSASALGVGTYEVDIRINGQVVGSATFQLR